MKKNLLAAIGLVLALMASTASARPPGCAGLEKVAPTPTSISTAQ
ncbi:hypothetical protein [Deinococcus koreensis]|nr:hypothetical protein [Deinococcus koreensis]